MSFLDEFFVTEKEKVEEMRMLFCAVNEGFVGGFYV